MKLGGWSTHVNGRPNQPFLIDKADAKRLLTSRDVVIIKGMGIEIDDVMDVVYIDDKGFTQWKLPQTRITY